MYFHPSLGTTEVGSSYRHLGVPMFPRSGFMRTIGRMIGTGVSCIPPCNSNTALCVEPCVFNSGPIVNIGPTSRCRFHVFMAPMNPCFGNNTGPVAVHMASLSHTTPEKANRVGTNLGCTVSLCGVISTRRGNFSRGLCISPTAEAGIRRANNTGYLFISGGNAMIIPGDPSVLPSVAEHSLMAITGSCLNLGIRRERICLDRLSSFTRVNLYKATTIVSPINGMCSRNGRVYFPSNVSRVKPAVGGLCSALAKVRVNEVRTPRN